MHISLQFEVSFDTQVVMCAFVGSVWCTILFMLPFLLIIWEPTRKALFNAWPIFAWLIAAEIFDKQVNSAPFPLVKSNETLA